MTLFDTIMIASAMARAAKQTPRGDPIRVQLFTTIDGRTYDVRIQAECIQKPR